MGFLYGRSAPHVGTYSSLRRSRALFSAFAAAALTHFATDAFARCALPVSIERNGNFIVMFPQELEAEGFLLRFVTSARLSYEVRLLPATADHPRTSHVEIIDVRPEARGKSCSGTPRENAPRPELDPRAYYDGTPLTVYGELKQPIQITFPCKVEGGCKKPVIYLYPPRELEVNVRLDFSGRLEATLPAIDRRTSSWTVTASPDGGLINHDDGEHYRYLFWEGSGLLFPFDPDEGFIVRGDDTDRFLEGALAELGFTDAEAFDFRTYWTPVLQRNRYNYIHFATDDYARAVPLAVSPEPESRLRVFMLYEPLAAPRTVRPQQLRTTPRAGFTLVEWGGGEISVTLD